MQPARTTTLASACADTSLPTREGTYRLRTIMPAQYTGRTAHIHVKVQAPNQPVLTTQLYFPDQPQNARDALFRPELLLRVTKGGEAVQGRFDFVLETG